MEIQPFRTPRAEAREITQWREEIYIPPRETLSWRDQDLNNIQEIKLLFIENVPIDALFSQQRHRQIPWEQKKSTSLSGGHSAGEIKIWIIERK